MLLFETMHGPAPTLDGVPASAAEVTAPIVRQLQESSYPGLRGVELAYDRGRLTLRGKLPTFYLKQLALALAFDAPDVEEIVDLIEVGGSS